VKEAMNTTVTCRLIVLQYNRRDLLEQFLPSIVRAAENSKHICKVTVLDNSSQDDSANYVRKAFPQVDLYIAKENRVLCSFNEYVEKCSEDYVVLLNNDMELDAHFVDPLIEPLTHDSNVAFVATEGDRSIAHVHYGILSAAIDYLGHVKLNKKMGPSLSAGVAAFDRTKYLELGGYDELYLPGRYEDVDLCYRAWKRGWKGVYQPASMKKHIGGASFDKAFDHHQTQTMVFRNAILFTIKNITDPWILFQFVIGVFLRLLGAIFTGKWFIWAGFFQSFGRISLAFSKRRQASTQASRSDREVISTVNQAYYDLLRSQNRSKAIVNFLGRHRCIRNAFLVIGFFTLRLTHPLQYLVIRELSSLHSVLDLGCGKHSMVPIIPTWIYTTGVEIFEPYYQAAVKSGRHTLYLNHDILTVEFPEKSFDAVVLLDVLEHLPKEKGQFLLNKIEKIARKKIVIFTPNGFLPQDDFDENPYMDHCSGWSAQEFKDLGYRVHGVRGFKSMYRHEAHDHEHEDGHAHANILDYGQIFTYHFPSSAFQLFCVKDLS
jgi:N-acetylglucosaminyl-diphospho-decaprenol L-rhamnosyltransferase